MRKGWIMNILRKMLFTTAVAAMVWCGFAAQPNPEAKLHKFSTVIEKERPELNEETRQLIAAYRKDPSEANRLALQRQVELNYDRVVARKKAKLEELRRTVKDPAKAEEMRVIVDEMLRDRENRINQSMLRFADPRLRPDARTTTDGFLPVIGAALNLFIARTPVTNREYAEFLKATGHAAPKTWSRGVMPAEKAEHPVVSVTWNDAVAYCQWLTQKDGQAVYRLPTAAEWEIAAGNMPKDADFNCGEHDGTTPVNAYAKTTAACGAVDMWGNCWEWTSSEIANQGGASRVMAVKGGAWNSPRTSCRTEQRSEGRAVGTGYDTVGFRIVREK